MNSRKIIVVTGATGHQGGAVTRSLLADRWHVRALTRNPSSPKARALAALGAEVVQGDMNELDSLRPVFQGAYGVYSVQNPMLSGLEAEVRQGKWVAEVAQESNVQHFVYGSAGIGKPTGIGSWDSKLQVEAYIKTLGLPLTVLRPMAFMELMTDKNYYPAVSTWYLMPRLMGAARPVEWINTDDLGVIVAKIFAAPERFLGQDIKLAGDIKTIDECRAIYQKVMGNKPAVFPLPLWLFRLFVGNDLITMWEWLRTAKIDLDTTPAAAIHPNLVSVEAWLKKQRPLLSK